VNKNSSIRFGYVSDLLDITTLSCRWFGAIWREENRMNLVLGYWFADSLNELMELVKKAGWQNFMGANDKTSIQMIYTDIRFEQKRQDWERRSRLPVLTRFKKPWKQMPKGYHVLFSRSDLPLIATCICKRKLSTWIEHVCVCENRYDIEEFVAAINQEHGITLKSYPVPQSLSSFS
jgi:hypothetical protein